MVTLIAVGLITFVVVGSLVSVVGLAFFMGYWSK